MWHRTYITLDDTLLACGSSFTGVKTMILASQLYATCINTICVKELRVVIIYIVTNNCHCKAVLTVITAISFSEHLLIWNIKMKHMIFSILNISVYMYTPLMRSSGSLHQMYPHKKSHQIFWKSTPLHSIGKDYCVAAFIFLVVYMQITAIKIQRLLASYIMADIREL